MNEREAELTLCVCDSAPEPPQRVSGSPPCLSPRMTSTPPRCWSSTPSYRKVRWNDTQRGAPGEKERDKHGIFECVEAQGCTRYVSVYVKNTILKC